MDRNGRMEWNGMEWNGRKPEGRNGFWKEWKEGQTPWNIRLQKWQNNSEALEKFHRQGSGKNAFCHCHGFQKEHGACRTGIQSTKKKYEIEQAMPPPSRSTGRIENAQTINYLSALHGMPSSQKLDFSKATGKINNQTQDHRKWKNKSSNYCRCTSSSYPVATVKRWFRKP